MGTVGVAVTSIALPFIWEVPDKMQWVLLATLGLSVATSHLCVIRSLQYAGASTMAPFGYVHLLSATILGYLIFDTLPDGLTVLGSLIIVLSGLFLFYRERLRGRDTGR